MFHRNAAIWVVLAVLLAGCGEKDAAPATDETPPDTSLAYANDDTARPAFRAGLDYRSDRVELDRQVEDYMAGAGEFERKKAFALIAPHAGYVFSGAVAASAYARVQVPDTVIMITPKHHGVGESPAVWNDGPWLIPGHAVEIRHDLVERFIELVAPEELPIDRAAFMEKQNHPLENQLPFLTTINPNVKIVPFAIYDNSQRDFVGWDLDRINHYGKALADLVREIEADGEDVLVVATTDLVHYIPLVDADVRDPKLMDYIIGLDVDGLHQYVVDNGITICGETAVSITMAAAIELGVSDVELTDIDTSYHRAKDPEAVVGYGGAVFWPGN